MKKIVAWLLFCAFMISAISVFGITKSDLDESSLENVNAVFYYDTTKDDISGSWKNNSGLSWYNEPSNPSDDFCGDLDNNRWEKFHSVTIENGRVKFSGTVLSGYWHAGEINSENEWTLSSDFDLEITYFEISGDNNTELRFEIKGASNPNHFLFVSRGIKSDGTNIYLRNDYNNNYSEVATSATSGRLRIVRTSSYITTYYGYWDAGSAPDQDRWKWTALGSNTYFGNDEIYVRIFTTSTQAGKQINATVDDFIARYSGGCSFTNNGSHSRSTQNAFPDRALLIATDRGIKIINADDNSLWMFFNAYDENRDIAQYQNIIADATTFIYALNGKIYTGASSGWMNGLEVIDFVNDRTWFYDTHSGDGTGWDFLGSGISERNMNRGWTDNGSNYVQLENQQVYDVCAKYIGNKTYVAVANGVYSGDNLGRLTVINLEDNTKSYDILSSSDAVTKVAISTNSDDYLYYLTENNLYCSYSTWRGTSQFSPNKSVSTAPQTNENSVELAVNDNAVFVGNEDINSPYTNGSITKRDLSSLAIITTYDETNFLVGSANVHALFVDNNRGWVGTNHSTYGKVNVIDVASDNAKGVFNVPDFLDSHNINSIAYCSNGTTEYLAVSYEDNTNVTVLSSTTNEISISNPSEGEIEYCFTDGTPFHYTFDNTTITIDPSNSKTTYGNVIVTLHLGTPSVPEPDHALAKWFEMEAESGFDAFPVHVKFEFTDPVPVGDVTKVLFFSEDNGVTWTASNKTSDITNLSWNYTTSPYYAEFDTQHFSYWGVSNGDGEDPLPVILSDFYANFISETLNIYWITQSENNSLGWNIYKSGNEDFNQANKINRTIIPSIENGNVSNEYVFEDKTPIEHGKTYHYWLENVEFDGSTQLFGPTRITIPEENENVPVTPDFVGLAQNYPNPFNPNTTIKFCLDMDDKVVLNIYNLKGEKVKTLYNGFVEKDNEIGVSWNGKNSKGEEVSSGIYFYKLISSNSVYVRKMLLLK